MKSEIKGRAVRVSFKTYNELAKLGNLQDSFDSVISNLLEQNHKPEKITRTANDNMKEKISKGANNE